MLLTAWLLHPLSRACLSLLRQRWLHVFFDESQVSCISSGIDFIVFVDTGANWDLATQDDVLFQTIQLVNAATGGSGDQDTSSVLE